ncbi:DUF2892 domain-containing protein [Clostridium sp. P21]|uniref:DUF2892 domain-containing protein n=1 Tax=Clostridium muellerianum TaxID=2716538 RepID=A0A7Y0EHV6_9CLOT|nr:DUF2892 domain-containing protein [Clostridium muellerianum]NMM63758.1 DUF2892 domain-containing protein [Clostridium muellerianum]
MFDFPATTKRVEFNTDKDINNEIKRETLENIAYYIGKDDSEILSRIEELDKEWDIERLLEANAASIVSLSTIFGFTINKKWFALSGMVGGFLLYHALYGWCPPVPIFRRLGIRTSSEINYEKESLKNLLDIDNIY